MDREEYGRLRSQLWREEDIVLLGRLLYGEARGTSVEEQIAVAHVVRNRSLKPGWWGMSVKEVCLSRAQFSCFNRDDPNFSVLMNVNVQEPVYLQCAGIAAVVLAGNISDPSGGATHYHSLEVVPYWAGSLERTLRTEHFQFYRSKR